MLRRTVLAMLLAMLLALTVVFAAACSDDGDDTSNGNGSKTDSSAKVFTDPGEEIKVAVGDTFVIELDANPSTGYSWNPTEPVDQNVLEFQGDSFESSNPGTPGAPGKEQLKYTAIGEGSATISLAYARPWETDVEPEDTANFSVVVG